MMHYKSACIKERVSQIWPAGWIHPTEHYYVSHGLAVDLSVTWSAHWIRPACCLKLREAGGCSAWYQGTQGWSRPCFVQHPELFQGTCSIWCLHQSGSIHWIWHAGLVCRLDLAYGLASPHSSDLQGLVSLTPLKEWILRTCIVWNRIANRCISPLRCLEGGIKSGPRYQCPQILEEDWI